MTAELDAERGDADLTPHPHRYILRGEPAALDFPDLCANCGEVARERVRCAKHFLRTGSENACDVVQSVAVPYCGGCSARLAAESPPMAALAKLFTAFGTAEVFGAVFPALAACFFGWQAIAHVLSGRFVAALPLLAFAAFLAFIAERMRRRVWRDTAHLRVGRRGDVACAFDWSDNVAPTFEPERFVCTVRDPRFAGALEVRNIARLWHPKSDSAKADRREGRRAFWRTGAIIAAVAVGVWLLDRLS